MRNLIETVRPPLASARPARTNLTRVLHLALLTAVIHQLVGSEFMELPFPGDPPGLVFSLHEYLGLGSVGLVSLFWVWTAIRRGETQLGRLLPWASPARLREVWNDATAQLARILRGHPPDEGTGALASATHGLGLLAVTAMAATGAVYFMTQETSLGHDALALHKLLANLVWAYLIAHAGLAALHHMLGSDVLKRMFWLAGRSGPKKPTPHGSAEAGAAWSVLSGERESNPGFEPMPLGFAAHSAGGIAELCLARAALCRASAAREIDPSRREALKGLGEKWEELAVRHHEDLAVRSR